MLPAVQLLPEIKTGEPRAVAAGADGSVLVLDTSRAVVTRIDADGTASTVAGAAVDGATREGFGGDGGPATSATFNKPMGLDVLADGSFVVADTGNERLRRVEPGGTIRTIAGGGSGWREGAPATAIRLGAVDLVRAGVDGSLLVAGDRGLMRLDPDGTIHTILTRHRAPGPSLNEDGREAGEVSLGAITEVDALPDGSLALAEGERVAMLIQGTRVDRLAVALAPRNRALLARGRVEIVSTRAARGTLRLVRRGRIVASTRVSLVRGVNRVRLRAPASTAPHLLRVAVRDAHGRVASHRLSIIPVGRLSHRTLLRHLDTIERFWLTGDTDVTIDDCRRVTARTFRCNTTDTDLEDLGDVTYRSRITLQRDGLLLYAFRLDDLERRSYFEPIP